MSDLGLDELSDDQLINLLSDVCLQLAKRDPIVRAAAQATIDQGAKRTQAEREQSEWLLEQCEITEKEFRSRLESAAVQVRNEYFVDLDAEITAMVRAEVQAGRWRVVTPDEEAARIASLGKPHQVEVTIPPGYDPKVIDAVLLEEFGLKRIDVARWKGIMTEGQINGCKNNPKPPLNVCSFTIL